MNIQSLERAFAIMEEVGRHREGINLAELAKGVGLHTSTTFHLVKTMVQLGYVAQMPDSKRYRIGSRLFTLAAGALEENTYLALATPVLEALAARTGEAAHFAIRSGRQIVVIARTAGAGLLQIADRNGSTRPPHATALGKVLYAAMDGAQLELALKELDWKRYTPKTIADADVFTKELADVRKKGFAYDDGEFDSELRCVAVPVHDFSGRVAGALGISGAIWRLSLQALQAKSLQVREAARDLSAQLGYSDKKPRRAA